MVYNYSSRAIFLVVALMICIPNASEAIRTKLNEIKNGQNTISLPLLGPKDICKSVVQPQGYICEDHEATTDDGYVLGMQRIPSGRSGKKADKPPVLLQHGIFSDATTWMFDSPEKSLAFILADNGFDVWLGNARGTGSSRGHKFLNPIDPRYWEWSWDELAAYDLPAMFKYVHQQTGQNLHYVGHSLGTLMAMAAFSQGKLLDMTRSATLLTPIAYLSNIPSPFIQATSKLFLAEEIYWLGLRQFIPLGEELAKLLNQICSQPGIDCADLLNTVTGPNCCINASKIEIPLEPTATKNLIHLAQMIRDGSLKMYDYGNPVENMAHYKQISPPIYDMTRIPKDLPLFLSYGAKDFLSDVVDVKILLDKFIGHDKDKLVVQFIENYAHLDFIRGLNADQVVYNPLMDFIKLH